jgi:hypothetical protein
MRKSSTPLPSLVNESWGWICRRLASSVACGVSTAAVDPATSWDKPGCPPLVPDSYEPPGDCCAPLLALGSCEPPGDCCAPPLALGSCEPPGDCCAPPLAPGSLEPPGDGPPLAPGSCEAPAVAHWSLLATGSLLATSLLPPESTWVARLQAVTLRARPAAANPATSRNRGPGHRSQTRTLQPGPLGQECGRQSHRLEEIVILNHIS